MTKDSENTDPESFRINNVLYFIEYKRKINPVNDVIATCESFYSPEKIVEAKKLFYNVLKEKNVEGARFIDRRDGKESAAKLNLKDIIEAMNKCDNENTVLPTFLSNDFSDIPQNSSGNVNLNQIFFMIVGMKKQIANLEKRLSDAPCSSADLTDSTSNSASTSESPLPASSTDNHLPPAPPTDNHLQPAPLHQITADDLNTAMEKVMCGGVVGEKNGVTGGVSGKGGGGVGVRWSEAAGRGAGVDSGGSVRNNRQQLLSGKSVENRVKSNFNRNRNIVIGKKPSSGVMSWSGADLTVDCYIGRVGFSVTSDVIKTSLVSEGIDVINIEENTTRHGLYKSFKLVVRRTDYDRLNSPEFWPEGVVFRRFRRPRSDQKSDGESSARE